MNPAIKRTYRSGLAFSVGLALLLLAMGASQVSEHGLTARPVLLPVAGVATALAAVLTWFRFRSLSRNDQNSA